MLTWRDDITTDCKCNVPSVIQRNSFIPFCLHPSIFPVLAVFLSTVWSSAALGTVLCPPLALTIWESLPYNSHGSVQMQLRSSAFDDR